MIPVTLDVNVLVSATIAPLGNPHRILTAWRDGQIRVVLSERIIAEVEAKLRLPRIARRYEITEADVRAVRALLETQAELVVVPAEKCPVVTGDPEDDAVLATARLGRVGYLVTGDRGLLDLGHHEGIAIVSPHTFLDFLPQAGQGPSP